jgi:hypothetical protein
MATANARLSFTPCPENPTARQTTLAVGRAYAAWRALQDRAIHPDGEFDDKKRWYPSAEERCDCCSSVRSPSAAWPFSLIKHCRSVEHVAARFRVEPSALRKRIRREEPPRPVVHADHYKLVAVVDGRYLSIFDGRTEYRLGESLREPARPDHGGGFYCHADLDAIVNGPPRRLFPPDSALADAPKAILRVRVGGRKLCYDGGKVAFSEMTPVAVIEIRHDDFNGTYTPVEVARA